VTEVINRPLHTDIESLVSGRHRSDTIAKHSTK
jgi:hypothetical protein